MPLADTRRSVYCKAPDHQRSEVTTRKDSWPAGGVGANDWARNEAKSPDIVVALYAQPSEIARALLVRHDTMTTPDGACHEVPNAGRGPLGATS